MFGLNTVSWTSFVVFAGVLSVTVDLTVVLAMRLRRRKGSDTDTIRKKRSEFFTDDPDEEITVRTAAENYEKTELEQAEGVKDNTTKQEERAEALPKDEDRTADEAEGRTQGEYVCEDGKFTEESITSSYVPQSEEEAIIGNGMRTYDEILSVIMGGKSDYQITEDASSSINKLFDKYATQSQEEKGEESLDEEGEPYAYGDFRDEDPSEGYTPECEGEECEFGENTLQRD